MSSLVEKARAFALTTRPYLYRPGEPRPRPASDRLEAIVAHCASLTEDETTLALAWVWDLVDTTVVTYEDVERELGGALAARVLEITPVSLPSEGTRAERLATDRCHFERASADAKLVRLAALVEQCREACHPKALMASTFVSETRALLDVLAPREARLAEQARELLARCETRRERPRRGADGDDGRARATRPEELTMRAAFLQVFSARHIAEALPEGEPTGSIRPDQIVEDTTCLSDVVIVLTRHERCFVRAAGEVRWLITRGDLQKPAARMWLFGIVTLAEMEFSMRIRALWPDAAWGERLSSGRLELAQSLRAERQRRGQHVDLVDCLQLSDKAQLLMEDPDQLAAFDFESRSAAKRAARELESLRNNLAHAQDIVAHDWPQIVRLAWRAAPSVA